MDVCVEKDSQTVRPKAENRRFGYVSLMATEELEQSGVTAACYCDCGCNCYVTG